MQPGGARGAGAVLEGADGVTLPSVTVLGGAGEPRGGEHRPAAPFFSGGFIPEESNGARGIKIAAGSRGKCACPSAGRPLAVDEDGEVG